MEKLNEIISKNLIYLRKKQGLNQNEFAKTLNYSNKTISKWELGYAIPSVDILKQIADYYGVTVDYLLIEHTEDLNIKKQDKTTGYKIAMMILVDVFLFLTGIIAYVAAISFANISIWPAFIYAAAACFFFNAIVTEIWWYKTVLSYIFASLCIWTLLLAIYFTLLTSQVNYSFWYLFFLGVPIQIATIIILFLKHSTKKNLNK